MHVKTNKCAPKENVRVLSLCYNNVKKVLIKHKHIGIRVGATYRATRWAHRRLVTMNLERL